MINVCNRIPISSDRINKNLVDDTPDKLNEDKLFLLHQHHTPSNAQQESVSQIITLDDWSNVYVKKS